MPYTSQMSCYVLSALFMAVQVGCAQPDRTIPLIPRTVLFTDSLVTSVNMDPQARDLLVSVRSDNGVGHWLRTLSDGSMQHLGEGDQYYPPKFDAKGNVLLFRKGKGITSFDIMRPGEGRSTVALDITVDGGYALAVSDRKPDQAVCFFLQEGSAFLFNVDLTTGATRMIEEIGFSQYAFDGDLDPVAASGLNDQGGISFYRFHDGEWHMFLSHPWDEGLLVGNSLNRILSASRDGLEIYSISHHGADKAGLLRTSVRSGVTDTLFSRPDFDLTHRKKWLLPSGKPAALAYYDGDLRWEVLDSSVQSDHDALQERLGSFAIVSRSSDDNTWLVERSDGGPRRYFVYRRKERDLEPIITECPEAAEYALAQRVTHHYRTRDGLRFPMQVYYPANVELDEQGFPMRSLPSVFYVHGGPWIGFHWDSWYSNRNFQLLADRGYVVLVPDFRGSLGYGKNVVELSEKQWGETMHQDILDATQYAVDKGISEKGQLCIYGWSYGGYEAMLAMGKDPDVFACGMALFGPTDLNRFLGSGLGEQPLWKNAVGDRSLVEDSTKLAANSPIDLLSRYEGPMLLSQGLQDELVPSQQMEAMADALHDNGNAVIYLTYANEGHDYQHQQSHLSYWAIAERFLEEHLKGRAQPAGPDLDCLHLKVTRNNVLPGIPPYEPLNNDKGDRIGPARIFEEGNVSVDDQHDDYISFAPDGNSLTITRLTDNYRRGTIFLANKVNGTWAEPFVAPFSGKFNDSRAFFAPTGKRLYFASDRPTADRPDKKDLDIWYVDRTTNGWGEARNLGSVVNSGANETHPTVSRNKNLYFARWGAGSSTNIFVSEFVDGAYQRPYRHPAVNTLYPGSHPYIDPNERFLLFGSTRDAEGLNGEVYITVKDDGKWSEPMALDPVNSMQYDYSAKVHPSGKQLFLSRADFGEGGRKADIYYLPMDLDDLLGRYAELAVFRSLDPGTESQTFPVRLVDNWPMVQVQVNGRGPYSFLIDLGASGVGRIDESLHQELGLKISGERSNTDGTGRTWTQNLVAVDEISLGTLRFNHLSLPMRDYWPEVEHGILAKDFFHDRTLTIDHSNEQIVVSTEPLDPNRPGVLSYGRPFVVEGKFAGIAARFSIDTGSQLDLHVSTAFLEANPIKYVVTGKRTELERSGGVIAAQEARINGALVIGSIVVENPLVWYSTAQSEERINLGSGVLKNYLLKVDQRSQLIEFSPAQ